MDVIRNIIFLSFLTDLRRGEPLLQSAADKDSTNKMGERRELLAKQSPGKPATPRSTISLSWLTKVYQLWPKLSRNLRLEWIWKEIN